MPFPFEAAGASSEQRHMFNLMKSFIRHESGAVAAEYALIVAVVGASIAITVTQLGTAISTAISSVF